MARGAFLLMAVLVSATTASAKSKRARTDALFLYATEGSNPAIVAAVETLLFYVAKEIPTLEMVELERQRRRLGGKPDEAMAACGSNIKCIAGLGRKVGANEVLYGRVVPAEEGDGVRIQMIAVTVRGAKVSRTLALTIPSVDGLKPMLLAKLPDIFGLPNRGFLEIPGYAGDVRVDGELIGTGPGPYEIAPGEHRLELAAASDEIVILPDHTRILFDYTVDSNDALRVSAPDEQGEPSAALEPESPSSAKAPPTAAPLVPPSEVEVAAVRPDDDLVLEETPNRWAQWASSPGWATYGGAGLAGLGLISLGVSAYFGLELGSANDALGSVSGTSQLEVRRLNEDASSAATSANLFFGVGLGAVVAGLGIVALDIFVLGTSGDEALVVEVVPSSTEVWVRAHF